MSYYISDDFGVADGDLVFVGDNVLDGINEGDTVTILGHLFRQGNTTGSNHIAIYVSGRIRPQAVTRTNFPFWIIENSQLLEHTPSE